MTVTPAQRELARQMDRDKAPLEHFGIRAAALIGFRSQQAAVIAYNAGRDPAVAFRGEFAKALPLIVDTMVAGHMKGRLREQESTAGVVSRATHPSFGGPFMLPAFAFSTSAYQGAIDFLRARLEMSPKDLKKLEKTYHAEALRVLKTASNAVEKRLQKTILKAVEEGMTRKQGVNLLRKAFALEGLTPDNSYTLEAIFRTQTQMAYSAGQWNADQDPAVQEILWGYRYVTVGDDRVRPEHVGFDGVTLPKDDPFWNINFPPCGWGCRCTAIPLFDKEDKVRPPKSVIVDGKRVKPEADEGFRFNPGKVFRDAMQEA